MPNVQSEKILIIEDQLIIAADIQLQLVKLGYQVIGIQHSAEDAILTIKKNKPDLILIDLGLGDNEKGMEVAQQISSSVSIPILFLSYGIDEDKFKKIVHMNPYALIPKPFQILDLKRGIDSALQRIALENNKKTKNKYSDRQAK